MNTTEIFLASSNAHKKYEMEKLLSPCRILTPKDIGLDFNPDENGNSFIENSIIKAKALYEIVKKPVLADDSGICVDALDGRPGIYSARYCGKNSEGKDGHALEQTERNRLLIEEVNSTLKEKSLDYKNPQLRKCHYACSLVLYLDTDRFVCCQETLDGVLIDDCSKQRGTRGFGYDPIVFLPEYDKTVAELTDEQKNEISHRGKCARQMLKLINSINF